MVSKTNYSETWALLREAKTFAEEILRPGSNTTSTTTNPSQKTKVVHHHHNHSHWGGPFFGGWGYYPQPVYVHTPNGSSKKSDDKWTGILLVGAAIAMLYPAAQNWAEWNLADRDIAALQSKAQWIKLENRHSRSIEQLAVRSVFEQKMHLHNKIRSEARTGFCLKGALTTSLLGAATTISGLVLLPTLPFFIGGAACVGAMVWRSGIRSIDSEVQSEALELERVARKAEAILKHSAVA